MKTRIHCIIDDKRYEIKYQKVSVSEDKAYQVLSSLQLLKDSVTSGYEIMRSYLNQIFLMRKRNALIKAIDENEKKAVVMK